MTDLLLKLQKQLFALTLVASVFTGFSIAFLSTTLVAAFLPGHPVVQPGSTGRSNKPERKKVEPVDRYYSIVTGNLIRDSGAVFNKETEKKMDAGPEAPPSTGDFSLEGLLAGDPSFARAAILIEGEQETNEYAIGETITGYRLLAIDIDSVVVKSGDLTLRVHVGEKTSDLRKKLAESQASKVSESPGAGEVPSDAERITIARSKLVQLTRDQSELYKNKFTPVMRDGKIMGFKLIYVPANNFLFELGARSGDIIRRINGQPMDNTSRMIEFYQSIQSIDRVTVDIERGGKIIPYEIIVN